MKKITFTVLLIAIVSVVVGCVDNSDAVDTMPIGKTSEFTRLLNANQVSSINDGIYRFHDDELNVTCYVYMYSPGVGAGGISCIPDSQIYGDDKK